MVLVVWTILGLGAIESYRIIHEIFEPDCPGKTTGNPATCIFCAHLQLLVAESAPELVVPRPVASGDLVMDLGCQSDEAETSASHPGRSPPAC